MRPVKIKNVTADQLITWGKVYSLSDAAIERGLKLINAPDNNHCLIGKNTLEFCISLNWFNSWDAKETPLCERWGK